MASCPDYSRILNEVKSETYKIVVVEVDRVGTERISSVGTGKTIEKCICCGGLC
jgi:hypothetical protein